MPKFLTVQEVAEQMKISEYLVLKMIREGRLPAKLVSGGRKQRFRVKEEDLDALDFVDFTEPPASPKRRRRRSAPGNVIEFF